jgi:hypothetical protein
MLQPQKYNPDYEHFHTPCVVNGKVLTTMPKFKYNFPSGYIYKSDGTVFDQCAYGVASVYASSVAAFMKEALIGNCSVGTFYSPLGNSNELLNCNP